ncbi:hypothetical protein KJ605_00915 [Patescibacteria group bacterium]|nr:hypothetical protein [Patescibacteria group bacterium]
MFRFIKQATISFLIISISFFTFTVSSFACSPAGPDPWYTEKLSFDNATLPDGIKIVEIDPTYEPYAFVNENSEPFYIVRPNNTDWKIFPNSELPKNYEPRFKITPGQVYFWGQLSSKDTEGWKPNSGGINNSAVTSVEIDQSIYSLDSESRQIYKDNRPETVDIPDPQNFTILAFYKGSPIEIKGTLSYSLNENYDPHSFEKGGEACNNWNRTSTLFSLLPMIFLLVIVFIILSVLYKFLKKRKNINQN